MAAVVICSVATGVLIRHFIPFQSRTAKLRQMVESGATDKEIVQFFDEIPPSLTIQVFPVCKSCSVKDPLFGVVVCIGDESTFIDSPSSSQIDALTGE